MTTIRIQKTLLALGLTLALLPAQAQGPSWWFSRGVIVSNSAPNDYAPITLGQLKWMVWNAYGELESKGAAGYELTAMIEALTQSNNYALANLGQVKNLAAPFYDRLYEIGQTNVMPTNMPGEYPWGNGQPPNDYAAANIGQTKYIFSFDLASVIMLRFIVTNAMAAWTTNGVYDAFANLTATSVHSGLVWSIETLAGGDSGGIDTNGLVSFGPGGGQYGVEVGLATNASCGDEMTLGVIKLTFQTNLVVSRTTTYDAFANLATNSFDTARLSWTNSVISGEAANIDQNGLLTLAGATGGEYQIVVSSLDLTNVTANMTLTAKPCIVELPSLEYIWRGCETNVFVNASFSPVYSGVDLTLSCLEGDGLVTFEDGLTTRLITSPTNLLLKPVQGSSVSNNIRISAGVEGISLYHEDFSVMSAHHVEAGPIFISVNITSTVPATVDIEPWDPVLPVTWTLANTTGGACRAMFADGTYACQTNSAASLEIVGLADSAAFGDVQLRGACDGVCFATNPVTICEALIPQFGYLLEGHTNVVHVEIRPEGVLTNVVLSFERIYTNGGWAAFTNAAEEMPVGDDTDVRICGIDAGQVPQGVRLKAIAAGGVINFTDFTVVRVTLGEIPFVWIPGTNLWEGPDNLWGGGTNAVYVGITPSTLGTNLHLEISRMTGSNEQYGIALFTNETSTNFTSESGYIQLVGVAASSEPNNMALTATLGNQIATQQTFSVAGFTFPNILILTNGLFMGANTNFDVRIVPDLPDEYPLKIEITRTSGDEGEVLLNNSTNPVVLTNSAAVQVEPSHGSSLLTNMHIRCWINPTLYENDFTVYEFHLLSYSWWGYDYWWWWYYDSWLWDWPCYIDLLRASECELFVTPTANNGLACVLENTEIAVFANDVSTIPVTNYMTSISLWGKSIGNTWLQVKQDNRLLWSNSVYVAEDWPVMHVSASEVVPVGSNFDVTASLWMDRGWWWEQNRALAFAQNDRVTFSMEDGTLTPDDVTVSEPYVGQITVTAMCDNTGFKTLSAYSELKDRWGNVGCYCTPTKEIRVVGMERIDPTYAAVNAGSSLILTAIPDPYTNSMLVFPSGEPSWWASVNSTNFPGSTGTATVVWQAPDGYVSDAMGDVTVGAHCGISNAVAHITVVDVGLSNLKCSNVTANAGSTTSVPVAVGAPGETLELKAECYSRVSGAPNAWPYGKPTWTGATPDTTQTVSSTSKACLAIDVPGTYEVKASFDGNNGHEEATIIVNVVAAGQLKYSLDDGTNWNNMTAPTFVWADKPVDFRVLPNPTACPWPTGKPNWHDNPYALATNTVEGTFTDPSTGTNDYKFFHVECGNEVTGNLVVVRVDIVQSNTCAKANSPTNVHLWLTPGGWPNTEWTITPDKGSNGAHFAANDEENGTNLTWSGTQAWVSVGSEDYEYIIRAQAIELTNCQDVASCWVGKALPPGDTINPEALLANTTDPINTMSGNLSIEENDLLVPCPGLSLAFGRNYNSVQEHTGTFGKGWTHTFEWSLAGITNPLNMPVEWMVLRTGDGREFKFPKQGETYGPCVENNLKLEPSGAGYKVMFPAGIAYSFDASGMLVSMTNAWTNQLTLSYTNGQLLKVEHGNGRKLDFSYDENLRLTNVWAATNLMVGFSYDANGRLAQAIRHVDGQAFQTAYEYGGDGTITQRVNARGDIGAYGYTTNAAGVALMGASLDVGGYYTHTLSYDPTGRTTVAYAKATTNQILDYFYNSQTLRLTGVCGPGSHQIAYQYDGNDNIINETLTDTGLNETLATWREYDTNHNVTMTAVGYNATPSNAWTFEWNSTNNLPTLVTDPLGNKVGTEYQNGSVSRIKAYYTAESSYDTVFTYGQNGLLTQVATPNGATISYKYDSYGHSTNVAPSAGPAMAYRYSQPWTRF